ncbi:EKC/KEOPS complex subunit LAGE3 [Camelus ferus]|uniref:L antigen family member 3 n=2 Tax=Camelus TaxID=9836 RepID=A0A8B7K611_CAMFR|nr:EKC/KEOPS complex subunit LAGE3-like [Camelus bactrianus]XP_014409159.1 EKC/KEOPS complex subunit LAGE3 [Camelus ferus]XP_031301347.1 EKC/KEOPS complex subunit LAGE3-like [Camelus dromedarius]
MQAPEDDARGATDGAGGLGNQQSPQTPEGRSSGSLEVKGDHSGPEGQGGPGSEGAVAEAAVAPPQVEQAPRALGPAGDAAPVAVGPGSELLEFTLTVPFRSPLEADMARRSLIPVARRHQGVVQVSTVNGSALAVRWTAEDPILFRTAINSFLDHLSLVIRNIRRFRPRLP